MSNLETTNWVLGKTVTYPTTYDPSILVAENRQDNRTYLGLDGTNLPFVGADIWNAYEFSVLTERGLPVTGVLRLRYAANSPSIVESKSLKLYLNSFNMTRYGQTAQEAVDLASKQIRKDLSKLLETDVTVFITLASWREEGELHPMRYTQPEQNVLLDTLPGAESIEFTQYEEDPSLIQTVEEPRTWQRFSSNLLRSNCKVTHQPDWGTVFISHFGDRRIVPLSLLRYIVSFRNENHFHEEVCEAIYKRLYDALKPESLVVACIYTRRGGIDICPVRASSESLLNTIPLVEYPPGVKKLIRQ